MRTLLDTNVVVDVLQRREPWFSDGRKIFYSIANKQIIGCITAKEAADIYYFSRKQFTGEDNADAKARQIMTKLYAVAVENGDYEDAVMIVSAERAGVDCIVTRNPSHFRASAIPVYSPADFAAMISEQTQ